MATIPTGPKRYATKTWLRGGCSGHVLGYSVGNRRRHSGIRRKCAISYRLAGSSRYGHSVLPGDGLKGMLVRDRYGIDACFVVCLLNCRIVTVYGCDKEEGIAYETWQISLRTEKDTDLPEPSAHAKHRRTIHPPRSSSYTHQIQPRSNAKAHKHFERKVDPSEVKR